ncbi:MAG: hypothetical protein AB4368_16300 [Xenococcaceae cyanobacterium]|nr:hypothetical protein [Xenococcaceae cyanobacterium MO_167.B52]
MKARISVPRSGTYNISVATHGNQPTSLNMTAIPQRPRNQKGITPTELGRIAIAE